MTRNEWIANTAARFAAADPSIPDDVCITQATGLAHSCEARNVAPWQSAPPLTDAAAKVVEAAVNYVVMLDGNFGSKQGLALEAAVRAYKESVK